MTRAARSALCSVLAIAAGCAVSSSSGTTPVSPMQGVPDMSAPLVIAPSPDPRVGLEAGLQNAGEAIWNLRLLSHTPSSHGFTAVANTDLAFSGTNVIQGSYNGFQIWDVSDPAHPRLRDARVCPASQSDVSVYKNLLFVSAEAPTARLDCGAEAPREVVSRDRIRGLRIFDITDIEHPKYLTNVQTCRGSHTHTVVNAPNDDQNVYVYISAIAAIRPVEELARCNDNPWDPNTADFRIEVVKIPLAHPEQAAVVSSPAVFADPTTGNTNGLIEQRSHGASLVDTAAMRDQFRAFAAARQGITPLTATSTAADTARCEASIDSLARAYGTTPGGGRGGGPCRPASADPFGPVARPRVTHEDSARVNFINAVRALAALTPRSRKADSALYRARVEALAKQYGVRSPFAPRTITVCHDITAYPAIGVAGAACVGMGLLLDIRDTPHPVRISAVADSNFSLWHSATFSNDGTMVLFADEWGGGSAPYCRAGDPRNRGADAIFKIVNGTMVFQSYYKLPAPQTQYENCVAHNGSLIPIPGRTIMAQAWYQGGLSIFEWTDPKHPHELAFFDRGPNDSTRLMNGGFWCAYWYNGHLYASEKMRGLDVFELAPSAAISQNEIDAAKSVRMDFLNVQDQPKFVWPPTFALSRAYTDQLERWHGLSADRVAAVRMALSRAEAASGAARHDALDELAGQVRAYAGSSTDPRRVQWLATSIGDLARAN